MSKRILDKRGLSGIIEIVLYVIAALGAVITLALPIILQPVNRFLYGGAMSSYIFWVRYIYLLIFGALMVLFLYQVALIFRSINKESPFIEKNVTAFSRMSMLCVLLFVDSAVYTVLEPSFFTLFLSLVFLFFAGLLLVLRELFRSAVQYKQENDYTI